MQGTLLALIGVLVGLAVWLARLSGKQSARLEALKREVKEYDTAQQLKDRVRYMPAGVVRRRLKEYTK